LKILLTGADGFTGRHFTAAALAQGHTVVALKADLTDRAALATEVAVLAPEAAVHLAGISFVGHADDAAFYAVNVVGTTNLLAALAKLPVLPQKVVLASSANVYGNCELSPISELQPAAPLNHYATSKLGMECMAKAYMDRLPLVIARPFNYTGTGHDINFVIPKLVDHFARRAPRIALGNVNVEREFNDVHMVCAIYLHLLTIGVAGETYNVCTGQTHTLQSVINVLTDLTKHELSVDIDPAFVRANELHRLCGDPGKLQRLLAVNGLQVSAPSLSDMLQGMLLATGQYAAGI
jgi:nucleoside-diphosphate-sugar epimerase